MSEPGGFSLHEDTRTRGLTEAPVRELFIANDTNMPVVKKNDGTVLELITLLSQGVGRIANWAFNTAYTFFGLPANNGATLATSSGFAATPAGVVHLLALAGQSITGWIGGLQVFFQDSTGMTVGTPGAGGSTGYRLVVAQSPSTGGGAELSLGAAGIGSDGNSAKVTIGPQARFIGRTDTDRPLRAQVYNGSAWENVFGVGASTSTYPGFDVMLGAVRIAGAIAISSARVFDGNGLKLSGISATALAKFDASGNLIPTVGTESVKFAFAEIKATNATLKISCDPTTGQAAIQFGKGSTGTDYRIIQLWQESTDSLDFRSYHTDGGYLYTRLQIPRLSSLPISINNGLDVFSGGLKIGGTEVISTARAITAASVAVTGGAAKQALMADGSFSIPASILKSIKTSALLSGPSESVLVSFSVGATFLASNSIRITAFLLGFNSTANSSYDVSVKYNGTTLWGKTINLGTGVTNYSRMSLMFSAYDAAFTDLSGTFEFGDISGMQSVPVFAATNISTIAAGTLTITIRGADLNTKGQLRMALLEQVALVP